MKSSFPISIGNERGYAITELALKLGSKGRDCRLKLGIMGSSARYLGTN